MVGRRKGGGAQAFAPCWVPANGPLVSFHPVAVGYPDPVVPRPTGYGLSAFQDVG